VFTTKAVKEIEKAKEKILKAFKTMPSSTSNLLDGHQTVNVIGEKNQEVEMIAQEYNPFIEKESFDFSDEEGSEIYEDAYDAPELIEVQKEYNLSKSLSNRKNVSHSFKLLSH
jgi:hypothetical protein